MSADLNDGNSEGGTRQLSGKQAYEARRQARKAAQGLRGLPPPQALARRSPAWMLWLVAAIGWLVALGEFAAVGLGLSWDWTPKVNIEAQASHFANDPLGTEFKVTNSGRVTLSDVRFKCEINGTNIKNIVLDGAGLGQEPIQFLSPFDDATRNCGTGFIKINDVNTLDFTVSYNWKFSSDRQFAKKHFVIRRGETGEMYAVPDQPRRRK